MSRCLSIMDFGFVAIAFRGMIKSVPPKDSGMGKLSILDETAPGELVRKLTAEAEVCRMIDAALASGISARTPQEIIAEVRLKMHQEGRL